MKYVRLHDTGQWRLQMKLMLLMSRLVGTLGLSGVEEEQCNHKGI